MIRSFRHKGLEKFFSTGSKAGIQAEHAVRLRRQLTELNEAEGVSDLRVYGWNLHALKGDLEDQWALKVNGNWRLTFRFYGRHVELLDYQDYH